MKKIYFLIFLLLPIFARGYIANIYLTSGCSNAVLVTGFVLGDYPIYDTEPFSFVCYPGDSNLLQTVAGEGADQGISVNGSYYPVNTVYVSADCSFPPTLGTDPDDAHDFFNDDDFWDELFNSDCQGMPKYRVSEPYLSLWLHDEPLGYQPASGPRLSFKLDYDQREAITGYNTNWFSFGKKWNADWLSYVTSEVDGNGKQYSLVHFPGGGSEKYYSNNVVDILTSSYLNGNTNAGFSVVKQDGSMDIYDFIVTNSNGAFEEAFMTQRINPQGQAITFNYFNYIPSFAPVIRLQSVVDADGRTNIIGYTASEPFSSNLITQVTDPFNRTSFLSYNPMGDLVTITDTAGNSTALGYSTNDWVTSMITPYGTNSFAVTDNGTNQVNITRAILITRPDNSHELFVNEDMAPGAAGSFSSSIVPNSTPYDNTFGNYDLNYHNTYYWGPRQYANLSTTNIALFSASDFLKARMRHWLTERGTFNPSGTLAIERDPSPDNGGATAGQTTWYDYPGKSSPDTQGNWLQPSLIARVLPDGTTAFNYYARNPFGLVVTNAATYSLGAGGVGLRMTTYSYAANNIDLITVTNALDVCVSSNWFNANHQPLVSYDALGQKTSFSYNANHQLDEMLRTFLAS
jgi:YD repeat-containing protein